jgi:hypothetical protein
MTTFPPVDRRCDLSRLDAVAEFGEVIGVVFRGEHAQRLANEQRQQNSAQGAIEPAADRARVVALSVLLITLTASLAQRRVA